MIKVLDKNVADKIAAGEVIERPVSIIKELIENSIDSGADSIVCEIKNGGKTYIRVTDNGCGINDEELETAFLRHATSKIEKVHDLDSIDTLGFRGEALASIAAVTHTEVISKPKDQTTGARVLIHGGEILDHSRIGSPDGTTIVVNDLFYNTPARLKFLKSDSAESSQIIRLMSELALCYKDTKFRFINNSQVLFSTLGDGNRLNTIIRVFSDVDYKNLVKVDFEKDGLKLEGYISTPVMSRTNRSSQIYFVNGRVVNSKVIEKGVNLGYKERLFEGRYPVVYLFLSTDPSTLDVNIHPNKREVRFDDEKKVLEFVSEAITDTLRTKDSVVDIGNLFKEHKPEKGTEIFRKVLEPLKNDNTPISNSVDTNIDKKRQSLSENKTFNNKQSGIYQDEFEEQLDIKNFLSTLSRNESKFVGEKSDYRLIDKQVNEKALIEIYEPMLKPFDFDELNVRGILFDTYITCADGNNFYLFDQHACHERINYEDFVSSYDSDEKFSQPLMLPIIINVSLSSDNEKSNWMEPLSRMGFVISEFGPGTYRIEEIPMFMELTEAETFVNTFIDNIKESTDLRNTVVVDKLIMMSCKASVKANDKLDFDEVVALINRLSKCKNPFSCPHGRPTFIKMSRYEIEKLFKRV